MIHQLFKYLWKPIIVVCKRFELNQLLVPQAALVGSIDEIYNYGLDVLFKQSEINMRRVKKAHQRYLYANTVID
jgi:ABC-type transport system involved in Fe-S cluster assembly fused permease/ATPase subunit